MSARILGLVSCNYNNDAFGSLTAERGMAALPFGGRYRVLDFPLSNMVNAGIRTIGVITPYHYRAIMDHVGAGKEWSLNRKNGGMFILPGSIYGLKNMRSTFLLRDIIQNRAFLDRGDEEFVLLSGSHKIYNMDLRPFIAAHKASGCDATLLYKPINDAENYAGTYLELDGAKVRGILAEAAGQAACFMDCFIIRRELLLKFIDWYMALGYLDLMDIIAENLPNLNVGAYAFSGYLGQLNNIRDYMACSQDLLRPEVRAEVFSAEHQVCTKIQDSPPAKYGAAPCVHNALVPTGCTIEGTVENSILFRGVKVGEGAVVKNCVIMQRTVIEPGAALENVICDKYVTVSRGNKLFGTPVKPLVIPKGSEI